MTRTHGWSSAVGLMVFSAALSTAGPAQGADAYSSTVDGITVNFGVVAADAITDRRMAGMHPQARHGLPGEHHVTVAMFDATTGTRISDAYVTAFISGTSRSRTLHVLEPMPELGPMTFGTYLPLPGVGPYEIRLEIRLPGRDRPIRTSFIYPYPGG